MQVIAGHPQRAASHLPIMAPHIANAISLIGNLTERFGLHATILVIACGSLAIGIGMLLVPGLHAMDTTAPAQRGLAAIADS
jgi:hypothetical protein